MSVKNSISYNKTCLIYQFFKRDQYVFTQRAGCETKLIFKGNTIGFNSAFFFLDW